MLASARIFCNTPGRLLAKCRQQQFGTGFFAISGHRPAGTIGCGSAVHIDVITEGRPADSMATDMFLSLD